MEFLPLPGASTALPLGISAGAWFVFALIAVALVLFATEPVPVDITAIGVLVALLLVEPLSAVAVDLGLLADQLIVLSDPAAGIYVTDRGLSEFASAATLTVLAMFWRPLELAFTDVTTVGIAIFWPL